MCFTIEIRLTRDAIEKQFQADASALQDFDFRYFYDAFDQPRLPVITQEHPHKVQLLQWGLIPHWTADESQAEKIRTGTYNARGESLREKPSFRIPFRQSRCLVLAHGFFEWQHRSGRKIPWYIRLSKDIPFAFAGICDTWKDPVSEISHHTFSIITTRANPLMEKIHNTKKRMPVLLPPASEYRWIAQNAGEQELLQKLAPLPEDQLTAYTVSDRLNRRDINPHDPEVLQHVDYPEPRTLF